MRELGVYTPTPTSHSSGQLQRGLNSMELPVFHARKPSVVAGLSLHYDFSVNMTFVTHRNSHGTGFRRTALFKVVAQVFLMKQQTIQMF